MLRALQPKAQAAINDGVLTLREKYGLAIQSVGLGEVVPLGVFLDLPSAVGLSTLVKLNVVIADKATEVPTVNSITAALIKRKAIGLSVNSRYASPADVEWTQQATKEWVDRLAVSN